MKKPRIGVLFGERSGVHEVSLGGAGTAFRPVAPVPSGQAKHMRQAEQGWMKKPCVLIQPEME
jgi:hypothetical protein